MARLLAAAWWYLQLLSLCAAAAATATAVVCTLKHKGQQEQTKKDNLSLWIDEQQVKMYSGLKIPIYAIQDGKVTPYILDKNFEQYLPVIPSEVGYVNFTWMSGNKKYFYMFDILLSDDKNILETPTVTVKKEGKIPKRPKVFSILLPCSGNNSGIAGFSIQLLIKNGKGCPLPDTPIKVKLRKECMVRGTSKSTSPDLECDKKCENHGRCNAKKICQCQEGYMGQYCKTALCYPQCMNNGTCVAPGVCRCPPGYQGPHCEGGICADKCLNGGKCIQKDTCQCPKGFYGLRCEYSKCIIPCLNGGKCKGVNKCRCIFGFQGDHCEIGQPITQYYNCRRPCSHGYCTANGTCRCQQGWFGKLCQRKIPKPKLDNRKSEHQFVRDDDEDDMDDNDYEEVPKSHHKWH